MNVSFELIDADNVISFNESAVCEYQGAICGDGDWFQVWYGDQTLPEVELHLANDDVLVFNHHTQCLALAMAASMNSCSEEKCTPEDGFGMRLLYSDINTEIRKKKIASGELKVKEGDFSILPDRDFIRFSEFKENGLKVENLQVWLTNEAYNQSNKAPASQAGTH